MGLKQKGDTVYTYSGTYTNNAYVTNSTANMSSSILAINADYPWNLKIDLNLVTRYFLNFIHESH